MEQTQGVSNVSPVANNMGTDVNGTQSSGATLNPTATQAVPYDRFAQVNQRLREAEARAAQLEKEKQEALSRSSSTTEISPSDPNYEYVRTYYKIPDPEKLKSEVRSEMEKEIARMKNEMQQAEMDRNLQKQMEELRKKYDGSDGVLPQFNAQEVLEYGARNQIYNLEHAYKLMHEDKFMEKRIKEIQSGTQATHVEAPSSPTTSVDPNNQKPFEELSLEEMEKLLPHI